MKAQESLKLQVNRILHAKVARIAKAEFAKVNPTPKLGKPIKPYSLPQFAHDLVAMLGQIESASTEELEQFAHYATTGKGREYV
jgi:hypothetical protein